MITTERNMEIVGLWLRQFFSGVVYPFVIVTTCVLIFGTVIFIAARAKTPRAVIAAVLPIVALPFLVVAHEFVGDPLINAIGRLYESARFGIGVIAAIALIEIGQILLRKESEIGPALFIFVLGSAGAFFVYALMSNVLGTTHFVFFGFVIGGGIYMIFRGVPVPQRMFRGWPIGGSKPRGYNPESAGTHSAPKPRSPASEKQGERADPQK
jgi:hypothetical protein